MKRYKVQLVGWDHNTYEIIESKTAAKAKGVYIKSHLSGFVQGYPKRVFFQCLRCEIIKD